MPDGEAEGVQGQVVRMAAMLLVWSVPQWQCVPLVDNDCADNHDRAYHCNAHPSMAAGEPEMPTLHPCLGHRVMQELSTLSQRHVFLATMCTDID